MAHYLNRLALLAVFMAYSFYAIFLQNSQYFITLPLVERTKQRLIITAT